MFWFSVFQVYMACQSMLIVLVGYTPEYRVEKQDSGSSGHRELQQHVIFTEDADSIVTEVWIAECPQTGSKTLRL